MLGAGGMGEVYRATDRNLGRDVALKLLPDALAGDPDRLARFQREARTLAALNHPNIGGIYGLEAANGGTALVMELVEGEDLALRIARGAIPLDEALPIASQIAEALEAAHDQGIIHRDLRMSRACVSRLRRVLSALWAVPTAVSSGGRAPLRGCSSGRGVGGRCRQRRFCRTEAEAVAVSAPQAVVLAALTAKTEPWCGWTGLGSPSR